MRTSKRSTKQLMAAVLAATGAAVSTHAATFNWTNTGGGTWNTPTNWTSGGGNGVPSAGEATTLDFSGLNTTFTATNDLGTQASPFTVNRLVFGTSGTPGISGGWIQFSGPNATLEKKAGGGNVTINTVVSLGSGVTLNYVGNALEAVNLSSTTRITGAGGIDIKSGSLVMISANTDYSGGTTLSGGELVIFAESALNAQDQLIRGAVGTGTLTLNGGIIRTNSANARTLYNAINIGGNFQASSGSGSHLNFAGPIAVTGTNATRTVTISNARTLTLGGQVSGTAGNTLAIVGNGASGFGTVSMGGGATDAVNNNFTGTISLQHDRAQLVLDKASNFNAIAGNLNYTAGSVVWNRAHQIADTATVTLGGVTTSPFNFTHDETIQNLVINSGTVRQNGGTNLGVTGTLTVNGGSGHLFGGTVSVGGLALSRPDANTSIYDPISMNTGTLGTPTNTAGTLILSGDVTVAGANGVIRVRQGGAGGTVDLNGGLRTFNVSNGAAVEDFVLSTIVADSVGGAGIRKTGLGTIALVNDASTLTGNSLVEQGRLVVYNTSGNATGSGTIIVSSGGTLGGNGRVAGVSNSGLIDPSIPSASNLGGGFSAVPTLSVGTVAFGNGGKLKLDDIGTAANDQLAVTDLLDLSGSADVLELNGSAFADADVVLATYGSISGVFDTVTFNGDVLPSHYAVTYTSTEGPGQMVLSVPEPSSMSLIVLAGIAMLKRKRRGRLIDLV